MNTTDTVVIERRINARPEVVFSFFTTRDRWLQWKGIDGTIEAAPGGTFRVKVTGDDTIAAGTFFVVDPHSRIVFSWGWEGEGQPVPPGSSIVEVTFEPDGDQTLLRLTHRDLPPDARAPHSAGWNHYLDRLAIRAADGDPGPDEWITANDSA